MTRARWALTVFSETPRQRPLCLFNFPLTTSAITSRSRGLPQNACVDAGHRGDSLGRRVAALLEDAHGRRLGQQKTSRQRHKDHQGDTKLGVSLVVFVPLSCNHLGDSRATAAFASRVRRASGAPLASSPSSLAASAS